MAKELTSIEAGAAVGLSEQAIRNHVLAGRLRARRHGVRGYYRITEQDLRDFSERYHYPIIEEALTEPVPVH